MKRPILYLLLSLLCGILVYEFIVIDWIFILFFLFVVSIFYMKYRNISIICMSFFIIGFFITMISYPNENYIGEKDIKATIIEKKVYDYGYQYVLDIDLINDKKVNFNVIFNSNQNFEIMDRLSLTGEFVDINTLNNFNTFNYRKYLKSKNIFYEFESDNVITAGHKTSIKHGIKNYIISFFNENLNDISAKFMNSMIVGYKVDDEIFEDFERFGLAHILAISGLHINILVVFLDFIGRNIGFNKKVYGIVIILFLVFYGYIIDFPVSILRVLSMYSLNYLNIYYYKIKDNLNSLFFGILAVLIINPFFIYSIGFYLSFIAIFSIYYLSEKIKKIFPDLPSWLILPLSIQLGTVPFLIHYFSSINILSILINLVFVPIMSYSLIFGFIYLLIPFLPIGKIIEGIFVIVEYMMNGVKIIGNLFEFNNLSMTFFDIFIFYLILLCILNYRKVFDIFSRYYKVLSLIVAFCIVKLFFLDTVIINFVDVDQGDAFMLRSNETILVDTGGNPLNTTSSGKKFVDYLVKNKVKNIDKIFLSHDDLDHIGNLDMILENIEVLKIYGNSKKYRSEKIKKNDVIKGSNYKIQVLLDGENSLNSNDSSLVLLVEVFGKNILLTGDIEKNEDKILVDKKIDFLKVSHHGSKNSTGDIFLENNEIENAIISVGENRYGHPSDKVIERLMKKDIKIYRTDIDGNIEIRINRLGSFIHTYNDKYEIWDLFRLLIFK